MPTCAAGRLAAPRPRRVMRRLLSTAKPENMTPTGSNVMVEDSVEIDSARLKRRPDDSTSRLRVNIVISRVLKHLHPQIHDSIVRISL